MEERLIPPELEVLFKEIKTPVLFSTVDTYPHVTPMNWLWLEKEGVFWFNPAGGTKKIENMQRNGNVCFGTVEEMKKGWRGFIVSGEITRFEYGFWALGRNVFIKKRMLVEKSGINFLDIRTYRFWKTYARHPDIHYSTLPWVAAFIRIKPRTISYWLGDQDKKEIVFED